MKMQLKHADSCDWMNVLQEPMYLPIIRITWKTRATALSENW